MDGIDGDRSTGNRIEDNDIRENRRFGIHLVNRSVHNVVRGNTVTDNGAGIVVRGDNVVEDNITS
jgi:parallel beta-helix repeat protein